MGTFVEEQQNNIQAPRRGECIALSVDVTARPYDLGAIDLGGFIPEADSKRRHEVFVTLRAVTADVWFHFSDGTSAALDPAAAIAVGGTIASAAAHGWTITAGTEQRFRIDRSRDTFLVCRTAAGTATLLMRPSSNQGG